MIHGTIFCYCRVKRRHEADILPVAEVQQPAAEEDHLRSAHRPAEDQDAQEGSEAPAGVPAKVSPLLRRQLRDRSLRPRSTYIRRSTGPIFLVNDISMNIHAFAENEHPLLLPVFFFLDDGYIDGNIFSKLGKGWARW